ncbi:hypothetical protein Z959_07900 [Clostridium novyi B str. ATCC 27606]|uniref:Uncharacterized protein n=1 Tax=Clostridium novyi B str. ATCC 27606 TaxID=1443123 RepID=A0AA40IUV2_CLONO|nr:hypothetical protein [Clostridium novyi]KEI16992.1 hypothetical protein Z959_07900 [Clostridium novyi B str. ATCC 27606]
MEQYNIDTISKFIGEEFKKRLTQEIIDDIHVKLGTGRINHTQVRENLSSLIDDDFLDNLYHSVLNIELVNKDL